QYLTFVEKKTASLFAASCEVGGLNRELKQFGLNFGIAFQIIDDYMDLMGEEKKLGKGVQQDLSVGEVTLPLIYLFEEIPDKEKKELKALLSSKDKKVGDTIRSRLTSSGADKITKKVINSYLDKAKESLVNLEDSMYKESFIQLVDFVQEKC
ncbi:MAG: polyprenyl synthetase family protein, partial [Candidatus Woesearchaeota archaeon]|nr:polyprenyl synthetase family protein [Candidatus Woesearchaeota archaeon]